MYILKISDGSFELNFPISHMSNYKISYEKILKELYKRGNPSYYRERPIYFESVELSMFTIMKLDNTIFREAPPSYKTLYTFLKEVYQEAARRDYPQSFISNSMFEGAATNHSMYNYPERGFLGTGMADLHREHQQKIHEERLRSGMRQLDNLPLIPSECIAVKKESSELIKINNFQPSKINFKNLEL